MSFVDDIEPIQFSNIAMLRNGQEGKLGAYRRRITEAYEHCGVDQLKACLDQARVEFKASQSELNAIRCEVLNELIGNLEAIKEVKPEPQCIFSGDYSRKMWDEINNAKTWRDLQDALYTVCCRLQEFETRMNKREDKG